MQITRIGLNLSVREDEYKTRCITANEMKKRQKKAFGDRRYARRRRRCIFFCSTRCFRAEQSRNISFFISILLRFVNNSFADFIAFGTLKHHDNTHSNGPNHNYL